MVPWKHKHFIRNGVKKQKIILLLEQMAVNVLSRIGFKAVEFAVFFNTTVGLESITLSKS